MHLDPDEKIHGHYYALARGGAPIMALEIVHTQHTLMLQRALYQQMDDNQKDLKDHAVYLLRVAELQFKCLAAALNKPTWIRSKAAHKHYVALLKVTFIDGWCLLDTRDRYAVIYKAADKYTTVLNLFTGKHGEDEVSAWVTPQEMGL